MINFLHTNIPERILVSIGPLNIYWYGFLIVIGMILAILIAIKLASYYGIKKDLIIDSSFWLIIGGVTGARIYHILLELPYYLANPLNIFKIWNGGLAIHGAIIAGIIITYLIARKNNLGFWKFVSLFTPGLALAMGIGRFGNYFNQENFGLPTDLSWGIPIEPANRISEYFNFEFFHPTFLYESIGNLIIFLILILIHVLLIKKKIKAFEIVLFGHLILYSILRFSNEYVRIDITPEFLGLRFPQIISLVIIVISFTFIVYQAYRRRALKNIKKHDSIVS